MAWVIGGKHFGQYTYEHWFDDEFKDVKTDDAGQNKIPSGEPEKTTEPDDSTAPHKPPPQP